MSKSHISRTERGHTTPEMPTPRALREASARYIRALGRESRRRPDIRESVVEIRDFLAEMENDPDIVDLLRASEESISLRQLSKSSGTDEFTIVLSPVGLKEEHYEYGSHGLPYGERQDVAKIATALHMDGATREDLEAQVARELQRIVDAAPEVDFEDQ